MRTPIAVITLLQQLLTRTIRQSKAFDKYQVSFLKDLRNSHSERTTEQLINECAARLNEHEFPLEETLSQGRLLVSQSQLQLQRLDNLSDPICSKIEQSKFATQPYSIIAHHNELTNIVKIYQRVVIELSNNKITMADDSPAVFKELSEALQQLILSLDISHADIKQLEIINKKIAAAKNTLELPQYCMAIISIIINSTNEERRSSRHFLYTLNDSLTQFCLNFVCNLKNAESVFEEQDLCVRNIQKKSLRLKKEAEQAENMESLRDNIFSYVENIEQLIKDKENAKEQKIRQKFQNMAREIKELQNETKNYQNTLKQQSKQLHTDFLTKIPNRAAWGERLRIEFIRYKRYQHPLSLAVIDIDKFKRINDTFGHLAGDKVLNVIAQTLQKSLRNSYFIARYGGEEFALLLPEISAKHTQPLLEELRRTIEAIPFKFKKESISISISTGCATFEQGDDVDDAFERADRALYHAKNNGRNQVVYFTKEQQKMTASR